MTLRVELDFETKSMVDLKKHGAQVYAQDPSTKVICLCYAIDDDESDELAPIQEWWPGKNHYSSGGDAMPLDLFQALEDPDTILEAHHYSFEVFIWMYVMKRMFGWEIPALSQWRCTLAVACYLCLPPALDKLGWLLFKQRKNPKGGRLITKYCKLHLKNSKEHIPNHEWIKWRDMTKTERDDNPGAKAAGGYFCEDFMDFVGYCADDVALQRRCSRYMGDLPPEEAENFEFDKVMNMRGLYLDQVGIDNATAIVEQVEVEVAGEFISLVGYKHTQRDRVMEWFEEQGLPLENMQKDYLGGLLSGDAEQDIPQGPPRRALEIRVAINKASTKKLDAMSRNRGADGRARCQTRYHGAGTGRNTGSGFQPLNLNRGFEDVDPDNLVSDISYRDPDYLKCVYGNSMDAIAKASRHWIMAQEGHIIVAADYVSVEAVILACIAGEQWKIDAFAAGTKIYEAMAEKIYQLPPGTVTKKTHPNERQDGKTCELAFGYQGALNAWLNFDDSGRHTDARIVEICKSWRGEHPMVVALWRGLEQAAFAAMRDSKRSEHYYRDIGFQLVDEWLSMILPNGKRLWYYDAKLAMGRPHWCQPKVKEACAAGECNHHRVPKISYRSSKTGWRYWTSTYGGKFTENGVQGTSREILMPNARLAEKEGYPCILTVYDEAVTEPTIKRGNKKELEEIMLSALPDFAKTWPISVDGWIGERYRK